MSLEALLAKGRAAAARCAGLALTRATKEKHALTAAALAAGVALYHVTAGMTTDYDSAVYVHAARSILAGDGFVDFSTGAPTSLWPPFYSVLLAVGSFGVFDPQHVAGPLNVVLFALTVFFVAAYLLRRLRYRPLALFGTAAVALGWPLLFWAGHALSETTFVCLATASLIATDKHLRDGGRAALVAAAVCAALACLTRYMGVAVVAAACVLLALQRGVGPLSKLRRLGLFVAVSGAPLGLWCLRSMWMDGTLFGARSQGVRYSPGEVLDTILACYADWASGKLPYDYVPTGASPLAYVIGGAALVALFAATLAFLRSPAPVAKASTPESHRSGMRREKGKGTTRRRPSRRAKGGQSVAAGGGPDSRRAFAVFGAFACCYVLLLYVALLGSTSWSGFQARYSMPAYLPFVLVAAVAADILLSAAVQRQKKALTTALVAALALALGAWLATQVKVNHELRATRDLGYSGAWLTQREVVRAARRTQLAGTVFSNDIAAVYLNTRWAANYRSLHCHRDAETLHARLSAAAAAGDVHVLWLPDRGPRRVECARWLRALGGLKPVAQTPGGALLRFDAAAASAVL